jgi:hypothetical protein
MSKSVYLVFSKPPDDLPAEEYERWYHHHVRENIVVPGFVSAERLAVQPVISGTRVAPGKFESESGAADGSVPFSHLAMYEYEGSIEQIRAALFERIQSGEAPLPTWFDRIRFATWNCSSIEGRITPVPYTRRWQ